MTRPTHCRWCGCRLTRYARKWLSGFCSKECNREMYDEDGRAD